ncbi:MAG: hypothetical protein OIF58_02155 [Cohaesibacter sp.]|nr:hypothetical protein [Cohaesibacter sp.]
MKKSFPLALALVAVATGVHAADLPSLSIGERIERGWYVSGSIGAEVMTLDFDDASTEDTIANTFWGIGGTAEVCKAGIGNVDWIDLCAGGHVFTSIESASEIITNRFGSFTIQERTETDVLSYGAFIKAKANMGSFSFAPYAGVRKIEISGTTIEVGRPETFNFDGDFSAAFGGAEMAYSFLNDRMEIGLGGEAGQSFDNDWEQDLTYYKAGTFLKVKF